jgi:outer membrane protein assembly factor BamD (BamD/ComL family)
MRYIKLFIASYLLILVSSCGNNETKEEQLTTNKINMHDQLLKNVQIQEMEMHKSPELNNAIAGLAIKAYYDFTSAYPEDSLTPDFLFKSAEVATASQQYPQALVSYQSIEAKYPNYKFYPESLFLEASLLDNYINDDAKAKIAYEKVIEKFPNSSYANDAKAAISNFGKSDAELHKEFMKKNKEK